MMCVSQEKQENEMKVKAKNGKSYYYDYKSLVLHPRVHERIKKAAEKRGITMSKLLYDTFSDE